MAIRGKGSLVRRGLLGVLSAILLVSAALAAGVVYEYDAAGRLKKATYDDGTVVNYTLDAPGNRTSVATTTAGDSQAPSAPGVPSFTAIAVTTATANWTAATDNVGVTGYRYRLNAGAWSADTAATSVGLTGLASYTAYTMDVQARDAAGNWSVSATNSFTTADGTAPSAPGTVSFSAVAVTTATVSWGAASDNVGVTGYRYRLNAGAWNTLGNVTTTGLTGLSASTLYAVDVQARDAVGNWGVSSSNSFTTGFSADTTAPSAPGAVSISAIAVTTATVSWGAASDNVAVTAYRYRLNAGAWTTLGNVTSVGLTGLASYTSYAVDVQAGDAAGNWGTSSSNSFTTVDGTAPSAPGTPTFSAITATTATASWTAASDNVGVTGYRYRLNGGTWNTLGIVLTVNLTGLTGATAYTVDVQARDAAGNWGASGSNSFTSFDDIPPGAPGTPSFSAITVTTATVSWTAASDNVGVTGYRYRINGGAWNTLGNVTSVGLTGLASYTSYAVDVQAGDASGNWGVSNSNSFTTVDGTAPSAPGTPTFSAITATTATASWTAASDNVGVTGYRYRLNGGAWNTLGAVLTVNLTGLTGSANYTLEMQATDAAGNWGASSSNSFNTLDATPPSAPGTPSFSAVATTSVTANWTAATDNVAVTGYRYRLNSGAWNTLGNVLTVNLSGLTGATVYAFDVQAQDAAGNWGANSSNSFTTTNYTESVTVTPDQDGTWTPGSNFFFGARQAYGGWNPVVIGTFSPTATANGKPFLELIDQYQVLVEEGPIFSLVYMSSYLRVGGFTSDPGADWLISIGGSTPLSYGYSNGWAVWLIPQLGMSPGSPVSLSIVHK
jgi:YD repeat-containing protein